MKRIVILAATGITALAVAEAPAQAAGVGEAPAQAAGCPTSGSACLYDSKNWKNFMFAFRPPAGCNSKVGILPPTLRNRTESTRNRTNCYLRLYVTRGSSQVQIAKAPPGAPISDLGQHKNQVDAVGFTSY